MKITYIAEISLTNRSAYTHHVLKMCDALSKKGNIELIIPFVKRNVNFNKIKKNFLIKTKKNFLIRSILNANIKNFLNRFLFGFKVAKFLRSNNSEIIISRSLTTSFFLCIFRVYHYLEIHTELKGLTKFLFINLNCINSNYLKKIILISKSLSKKFTSIKKKKILVLHDAVDIKDFRYKPKNTKLIKSVTYVGSFYKGKGVDLILELANKFKRISFNIYGDTLGNYYQKITNVKFHGYIDYHQVPEVLVNSDILILPSADIQFGRAKNINITNYNSPLKMFDYLAAGKIILASKRDGICEILKHNYNSVIVQNYNLEAWSKTLEKIIRKKYNLVKLRNNSIKTAKNNTWDKRVAKILNST
jgi:glycosyltransferase involved in cell wall biosynthesis